MLWYIQFFREINFTKFFVKMISRKNSLVYFLPFNSGHKPAKTAATPDAPPPSTMAFSISRHLKMAIATHSSDTVTILSMRGAKKKKFKILVSRKVNYTTAGKI